MILLHVYNGVVISDWRYVAELGFREKIMQVRKYQVMVRKEG